MFFGSNDEKKLEKFLKKEEKHKVNAISFYELFLMCQERFLLIENELYGFKELLKNYFKIENIVFKENIDGDMALVIEFNDNKKEYIVITSDDSLDINIVLDTTNGKYDKLIEYAKPLIIKAFNKDHIVSLSKTFVTTSSSKTFNINSLSNDISLTLNNKNLENYFHLNYLFDTSKLEKDDYLKYFTCNTNFWNLKEDLMGLQKLRSFLNNIKINEEDVPRILKKNLK